MEEEEIYKPKGDSSHLAITPYYPITNPNAVPNLPDPKMTNDSDVSFIINSAKEKQKNNDLIDTTKTGSLRLKKHIDTTDVIKLKDAYAELPDGDVVRKYSTYRFGTDNNERLALEQSWKEQGINGLTKAGKNFATGVFNSTVGTVYGLGSAIINSDFTKIYDNEISNYINKVSEIDRNLIPNYVSEEEKNKGVFSQMGTMNFWADKFAGGLSFTASAIVSEGIWAWATGGTSLATMGARRFTSALRGAKGATTTARVAGEAGAVAGELSTVARVGGELATETGGVAAGLNALGETGTLQAVTKWKNLLNSPLGKMYQTGKISKSTLVGGAQFFEAVGGGVRALRSATNEASVETWQFKKEQKELFKEDFIRRNGYAPTPKDVFEFEKNLDDVANTVYLTNLALVSTSNVLLLGKTLGINRPRLGFSDFINKKAFGTGLEEVSKGVFAPIKRSFTQKAARNTFDYIVKPGVTEGLFEEGGQSITQFVGNKWLQHSYDKNKAKNTFSFMEALGDGMKKQYTTEEGWKENMLGILIGVVGGGRNTYLEQAQSKKELEFSASVANTYDKKTLQSLLLPSKLMNLNRIQGFGEEANEEYQKGNMFRSEAARDSARISQINASLVEGNSVKETVEKMQSILDDTTKQEWAEAGVSEENIEEEKAKALEEYAKLAETFNTNKKYWKYIIGDKLVGEKALEGVASEEAKLMDNSAFSTNAQIIESLAWQSTIGERGNEYAEYIRQEISNVIGEEHNATLELTAKLEGESAEVISTINNLQAQNDLLEKKRNSLMERLKKAALETATDKQKATYNSLEKELIDTEAKIADVKAQAEEIANKLSSANKQSLLAEELKKGVDSLKLTSVEISGDSLLYLKRNIKKFEEARNGISDQTKRKYLEDLEKEYNHAIEAFLKSRASIQAVISPDFKLQNVSGWIGSKISKNKSMNPNTQEWLTDAIETYMKDKLAYMETLNAMRQPSVEDKIKELEDELKTADEIRKAEIEQEIASLRKPKTIEERLQELEDELNSIEDDNNPRIDEINAEMEALEQELYKEEEIPQEENKRETKPKTKQQILKEKIAELEKERDEKIAEIEKPTIPPPPENYDIVTEKTTVEDKSRQALRDIIALTDSADIADFVVNGDWNGEGLLGYDENDNVVLTRFADSTEGLTKSGQISSPDLLRSLMNNFGGEQIPTSGVAGGMVNYQTEDGVVGTYRIPIKEFKQLIKDGYIQFAGFGNKEFVLSPHIAKQYLTEINGEIVKAQEQESPEKKAKKEELQKERERLQRERKEATLSDYSKEIEKINEEIKKLEEEQQIQDNNETKNTTNQPTEEDVAQQTPATQKEGDTFETTSSTGRKIEYKYENGAWYYKNTKGAWEKELDKNQLKVQGLWEETNGITQEQPTPKKDNSEAIKALEKQKADLEQKDKKLISADNKEIDDRIADIDNQIEELEKESAKIVNIVAPPVTPPQATEEEEDNAYQSKIDEINKEYDRKIKKAEFDLFPPKGGTVEEYKKRVIDLLNNVYKSLEYLPKDINKLIDVKPTQVEIDEYIALKEAKKTATKRYKELRQKLGDWKLLATAIDEDYTTIADLLDLIDSFNEQEKENETQIKTPLEDIIPDSGESISVPEILNNVTAPVTVKATATHYEFTHIKAEYFVKQIGGEYKGKDFNKLVPGDVVTIGDFSFRYLEGGRLEVKREDFDKRRDALNMYIKANNLTKWSFPDVYTNINGELVRMPSQFEEIELKPIKAYESKVGDKLRLFIKDQDGFNKSKGDNKEQLKIVLRDEKGNDIQTLKGINAKNVTDVGFLLLRQRAFDNWVKAGKPAEMDLGIEVTISNIFLGNPQINFGKENYDISIEATEKVIIAKGYIENGEIKLDNEIKDVNTTYVKSASKKTKAKIPIVVFKRGVHNVAFPINIKGIDKAQNFEELIVGDDVKKMVVSINNKMAQEGISAEKLTFADIMLSVSGEVILSEKAEKVKKAFEKNKAYMSAEDLLTSKTEELVNNATVMIDLDNLDEVINTPKVKVDLKSAVYANENEIMEARRETKNDRANKLYLDLKRLVNSTIFKSDDGKRMYNKLINAKGTTQEKLQEVLQQVIFEDNNGVLKNFLKGNESAHLGNRIMKEMLDFYIDKENLYKQITVKRNDKKEGNEGICL